MLPAPIPANEPERIASLRRMLLLSTPDEQAFDRVTRAVQRMFKVPIALISLVDTNRQWFKSCIGLPVRETRRDVSFCGHAILGDDVFVIENARADPRFADNPLVTGEPHVIFYAGRPLRNAEGFAVGTLCVIDHEPREFSAADRATLNDLGYWVEHIFLGRELGEAQKAMLEELDEVRRSNMLDAALNIWNAAAMEGLIGQEVQRADRGGVGLSLVKLAWREGDAADLGANVALLRRLQPMLRPYDSLGCADEAGTAFWWVLPHSNAGLARQLVGRLSDALELEPVSNSQGKKLTLDLGAASADFLRERPSATRLCEQAQEALDARRQGRSSPGATPEAATSPVY